MKPRKVRKKLSLISTFWTVNGVRLDIRTNFTEKQNIYIIFQISIFRKEPSKGLKVLSWFLEPVLENIDNDFLLVLTLYI